MSDMESLGDILKRLMNQQRREPVEGDLLPEEPKAPACTICGDAGWVTRNVPVGDPDFGEAFPLPLPRRKASQGRRCPASLQQSGRPGEDLPGRHPAAGPAGRIRGSGTVRRGI